MANNENGQYVYLSNIANIKNVFEHEFDLLNPQQLKGLILADGVYIDPDTDFNDENLYDTCAKYYDLKKVKKKDRFVLVKEQGSSEKIEDEIEFGLDGVIGISQIFDIVFENKNETKTNKDIVYDTLDYYNKIRGRIHGQVLFPCRQYKFEQHRIHTINQFRYRSLYDRIDYTLADIKAYLSGNDCKMKAVLECNKYANKWLSQYKSTNKNDGWKKLVDDMKWNVFMDELEVLDLSKAKEKRTLSDWPRLHKNESSPPDIDYLNGLIYVLKNSGELTELMTMVE